MSGTTRAPGDPSGQVMHDGQGGEAEAQAAGAIASAATGCGWGSFVTRRGI